MDINIQKLANRQLSDFRLVNPGTCFEDNTFFISNEKAYALQDEVTKLRVRDGEKVVGFKVGCTGPGTTKLFGMEGPIRGTLFDKETLTNNACLDPHLFCNLAVEAEMAMSLGENKEITSVFPIIELHNFVFKASKKSLSELIANNGLNRGLVLSEKYWKKKPEDYDETHSLSLEINGYIIDKGDLWPMKGGPSSSLEWLSEHLTKYNHELLPGNIVLGGTALGLHLVKPGDDIRVKINDQTAVHCSVNLNETSN